MLKIEVKSIGRHLGSYLADSIRSLFGLSQPDDHEPVDTATLLIQKDGKVQKLHVMAGDSFRIEDETEEMLDLKQFKYKQLILNRATQRVSEYLEEIGTLYPGDSIDIDMHFEIKEDHHVSCSSWLNKIKNEKI